MLWPEDMPPDTVICMSGKDVLVPNSLILRHLSAVDSSTQARSYLRPPWMECAVASFSPNEDDVPSELSMLTLTEANFERCLR